MELIMNAMMCFERPTEPLEQKTLCSMKCRKIGRSSRRIGETGRKYYVGLGQ